MGLEHATIRLVEEQQALLALHPQQPQQPQQAPRQWQRRDPAAAADGLRSAGLAPVPGAGWLAPAANEQQQQQQRQRQGSPERQQGLPALGYGQFLAEARQLLHDCGELSGRLTPAHHP